jgi:HlyD family secretion protein
LNRRIIAILVVIAAIAGGGYWWFKGGSASAATATQYKLTKVETGEVKKTVSASGTLQAWEVVDIKARAGGELTTLAVDVGNEVKKGQLLAKIDPLDVRLNLNTATANEESARARKEQNQATYELQVAQSQIAIENARASLQSAEASSQAASARLATARQQAATQPELTRAAIANSIASYNQALKQRQQLEITNQQDRVGVKAAYDQAIANQKNAYQTLERQKTLAAKGFVSQQAVDTAVANLSVVDAQVASAKSKLDTIQAEQTATIANSDARVNQAKASLESSRAGTADIVNRQNAVREAEASYKQSQAQIATAKAALNQAIANQQNNKIRSFDIKTATASIASAEASRINAQTSYERTEIRAPSDGIVLQKYVEQGTIIASALSITASGTNILQMGNISRMYCDISVDETDIANVDVGQKVEVAIDAYPGVPFEGKVYRIDPLATVNQNVTSVHVRVEVDNSAPTFRLLKPGMNATCQFVLAKKTGVVKVPSEAVREDDKGKYVEVATGGVPAPPDPKTGVAADADALVNIKKERRAVEVGTEGNDSVEIVSGVKDGEKIVTQTIEPATTAAAGSPFGASGGFGGGRGGFGGGGGGGRGR